MNQPIDPEVLTFYRIVRTNPPTEEDMRSHHDLGLPLRSDTAEARLARGISLFDGPEESAWEAMAK